MEQERIIELLKQAAEGLSRKFKGVDVGRETMDYNQGGYSAGNNSQLPLADRSVKINSSYYDKSNPLLNKILPPRETISHEVFHANHPILGRSESITRAVGGYQGAPKGSNLFDRLAGARDAVSVYDSNDPIYQQIRSQGLESRFPGLASKLPVSMLKTPPSIAPLVHGLTSVAAIPHDLKTAGNVAVTNPTATASNIATSVRTQAAPLLQKVVNGIDGNSPAALDRRFDVKLRSLNDQVAAYQNAGENYFTNKDMRGVMQERRALNTASVTNPTKLPATSNFLQGAADPYVTNTQAMKDMWPAAKESASFALQKSAPILKNVAQAGVAGAAEGALHSGLNQVSGVNPDDNGANGYWSGVGHRVGSMVNGATAGGVVGGATTGGVGAPLGALGGAAAAGAKNIYDAGKEGVGMVGDLYNLHKSNQALANNPLMNKPKSDPIQSTIKPTQPTGGSNTTIKPTL